MAHGLLGRVRNRRDLLRPGPEKVREVYAAQALLPRLERASARQRLISGPYFAANRARR